MEREQELAWWLALRRSPGLGDRGCLRLLEHFGAVGPIFEAGSRTLEALGLKSPTINYLKTPNRDEIERDLAWASSPDHQVIVWGDPDYPKLLSELPDPPVLLFVIGEVGVLNSPQLAIVGSRNPSAGGLETASGFAGALVRAGLSVTSGLALGIDAASHRAALSAGGTTIAVAGTGPDKVYPARHLELAQTIAKRGAIVTEFSPGTPPSARNFPRRNRIISGLTVGTLVVEASIKSGSLITAALAMEQGREVFAVPGSIHSPLSRGCHRLIRNGAKLVETVDDIIEELGPLVGALVHRHDPGTEVRTKTVFVLDAEHRRLLDEMGFDPSSIDTLVARTGLTAKAVSSMLLALELKGYVDPQPGGQFVRRRP